MMMTIPVKAKMEPIAIVVRKPFLLPPLIEEVASSTGCSKLLTRLVPLRLPLVVGSAVAFVGTGATPGVFSRLGPDDANVEGNGVRVLLARLKDAAVVGELVVGCELVVGSPEGIELAESDGDRDDDMLGRVLCCVVGAKVGERVGPNVGLGLIVGFPDDICVSPQSR